MSRPDCWNPIACKSRCVRPRRIARECNADAARLGQDHKGKYGSFAMLPMHDADRALRELECALATR